MEISRADSEDPIYSSFNCITFVDAPQVHCKKWKKSAVDTLKPSHIARFFEKVARFEAEITNKGDRLGFSEKLNESRILLLFHEQWNGTEYMICH